MPSIERIVRVGWRVLGFACCMVLMVATSPAYGAPKHASKSKAKAKEAPEKAVAAPLPWALRDHLIFPFEKASFLYDVPTGLWRVETEGVGAMLDGGSFEVALADGSTVKAGDLGQGTFNREAFSTDADKGTMWSTVFPANNGLAVTYMLVSSARHPFLRVELSARNAGDVPITIAALKPMVVPAGAASGLSPSTSVSQWLMQARGQCGVFSKQSPALFTMLNDPANTFCLAMGVLPAGVASSGSDFQSVNGAWQGAVTSSFDPPVTIAPGGTVSADPVWVSFGMSVPAKAAQFYALALGALPGMEECPGAPRCWVTVGDDASSDELVAAAQQWASTGVRHALVPAAWEERAGSLRGAAPRWPRDIKQVAQQIRAMNMIPGLTLNPLVTEKGDPAWSAASPDGPCWVNVATPEGRNQGGARVREAIRRGFGFLVIPPVTVPEDVLRQFKLTRAQAECLAFQMVREAAGDVPVLPSSAVTLGAEADAWLEAAAGTSVMKANRAAVGPVRFDVTNVDSVTEELVAALHFIGAPVELVGSPKKVLRDELARVFASTLYASPVGLTAQMPRLWHTWSFNGAEGSRHDSVVMLRGASGWKVSDLGLQDETGISAWRAEDGVLVSPETAPIPQAERLTVYGLSTTATRPALLGASAGWGLLMDSVTHLKWTDDGKGEGILSGMFQGTHAADAKAYVVIPAGWEFRNGKAGQESVPRKSVSDRLEFTVAAGRPTAFELRFRRQ